MVIEINPSRLKQYFTRSSRSNFFVPQIFAVRQIDSAPLKILNTTRHYLAVKGEQNLYLGGNQYFGSNPPIWTLVHTEKKGPYVKVRFSVFILMRLILVCGGPQTLNDGGKVRAHIPFQNSCIIDIFILLSVANEPQQWLHQYTTNFVFGVTNLKQYFLKTEEVTIFLLQLTENRPHKKN